MKKIKNFIVSTKTGLSNFLEKVFSDRKSTIKFIAIFIFTVLFGLQISNILIRNSFYNNYSDDILQYYTGMVDFISGLKDGSISWFNLNNYFGASFFSDVYYVPLDMFTGITFVLSYLMPIEVAYSTTELIKIFIGVMLFAYYLSLNNMKNRTIFWMSILYFISGGTVSFMAFPVFLSLTAYLPLALIVIHFFLKKKRWIVPLFALVAILYDFYLGYSILAFSCFAFIIEYVKRPNFKFFIFVKELIFFVVLLLLGVLMSAIIAYPSIVFILEETFRTTGDFPGWVVYEDFSIFGFVTDIKFFQPDVYIRILAKIFTEQRPVGFYGFENNYALEHISLYISIIGFAYMNYVLFMRDKISRVYKVAIFVSLVFMWFPLFSYIFSGTLDMPYTRWINMLPIFQLMILSHVFDKYGFEKIQMKKMTIIILVLLGIVGYLIMYYGQQLSSDSYLAARDMLGVDRILMMVSAGYLVLFLIFGWLKKWNVVKFFLWVEIVVAVIYIYCGSFYIPNKIDTFENAYQIDEYLDTVLESDNEEFYRVYVDINNLGVEYFNFNRMTGYATNTGIFHSWTDSETNGIGYLLYNVKEYQSKNKMSAYTYYVNHFLGYKYILVDAENNYDFDSDYFELYSETSNYKLYKIKNASPFKVYETYLTEDDFITYRKVYSDIATQKVFVDNAILDDERYILDFLNLEEVDLENAERNMTIRSYSTLYGDNEVTTGVFNDYTRLFYKYDVSNLSSSNEAGAMYINMTSIIVEEYKEVFMVFPDETRKSCTTPSDESYDIKCEFNETPSYIFIEDTGEMYHAPAINVRYEAAIDAAAYMVYDLSNLDLDIDSGFMNLTLSKNIIFETAYVIDEFGDRYDCLNGFYSFNSKPDKLYVLKTGKMYDQSNLFSLNLKVSCDSLENSINFIEEDYIEDKYLKIENGKIDLWYYNLSESDNNQIVSIPVCYSDDWVFTDGKDYETISVNGGFLGIIIPNGVNHVSISMEFIPKGLDIGLFASLSGILLYLGIFLPSWIKNKKRKDGDDRK